MLTYLKIIVPLFVAILFTSCKSWDFHTFPFTKVKKAPKNTLFVYKTNIKLSGNLSKTERNNLESRLRVQLEDSVNPRASQKILWQTIKKPPVFDTTYVQASRKFMLAMLHTSGYFKSSITYDTVVKRNEELYMLTLNFNVAPGPLWHFDSVWYNIQQPELQQLTDSALRADTTKKQRPDSITLGVQMPLQKLADSTGNESFLKKGSSFSQDTIAMELDRLVELYRNNGYMRFTRNELIGVWDTLDVSLLKPMVNPLEQIEIMNAVRKEKENPTATLEIKLRHGYDSSRLVKFYVGKVYIYPDFGPDSTDYKTVVLDSTYTVKYHERLFKPKILPQNIYLRQGQVYSQTRYTRTINRFNTNVAWRLVNIELKPRPETDTVDFYVKLIPAKKYLFVANLEGSRNDNSVFIDNTNAFSSGNLFGIGINLSLQNRNFARAAAQTNTSLRYGTELSVAKDQPFVASRQASAGYNIVFPKIIPHFSFLPERFREAKTVLAFNLANTQRINLYNLTTFNTSWSYELQRRNKFYGIKFPNVEYYLFDPKPFLDSVFKKYPGLSNLFNDGLVVSLIGSFTVNWGTKKNLNTFKINGEISGLPTLIHSDFIKKNLYRFVKTDAEFKRIMSINTSTQLVARIFTGVGIPFAIQNGNEKRSQYLPFFKAYTAGGPNSMRGWGFRRLGPGHTSLFYDSIPDRFGDIQLEANLEYRFHAFNLLGFKFNSALFTDVGNVWFMRENSDFPGGEFSNKFLKDLGVDIGTGLRVDLGFFLIRLDYALKARNPSPEPVHLDSQFKWFYGWQWRTLVRGVLQFGVTYPF
ncbi:MAG TPA: BamA/TamA family outer membrane protein [Chitinophagaceae bacterium]|jgi:outer membrane protein assembly factor BamA|nr:BamA/TamA family outer membrane protein [Chitinophagaceae bacterium]